MAEVRIHASRVLRRRFLSDGTRRGIDGYFAITHGERPLWWKEDTASGVLGVFENIAGSEEDALIIDSAGVTVRSSPGERLAFAEIAELVPPPKQPMATVIECRMRDGTVRTLPVRPREGQIMDIYRFLLSAVGEFRTRR